MTNWYLWGLDLAGQRSGQPGQAAGGIGGLVSIRVEGQGTPRVYLPVADQVGNIRSVINAATLAVVAWISYAPYGEVQQPWYADAQTRADLECASMRFQSKFQEQETGFSYYGYRWYNPATAKWLNRDPLGENGGVNLTAFCGNDPINSVDALGLEILKYKSDPKILGLIPAPSSSVDLGGRYMYGTTLWEDSLAQCANMYFVVQNGTYGIISFAFQDMPLKPDNSLTTKFAILTAPVGGPAVLNAAAESGAAMALSRVVTGLRATAVGTKVAQALGAAGELGAKVWDKVVTFAERIEVPSGQVNMGVPPLRLKPASAVAETTAPKFFHSTSPGAVKPISEGGFRTDLPDVMAAGRNNRFGRGVYLSDSPVAALAERPGGAVLTVDANLGRNLNITARGPICDAQMAKAIARGARKHAYDSITTLSVREGGGVNTILFDPTRVTVTGVVP